jgi:hypothetical protein
MNQLNPIRLNRGYFFLIDFLFKNHLTCFPMHHSFDFDESGVSLHAMGEGFLNKIFNKLKKSSCNAENITRS